MASQEELDRLREIRAIESELAGIRSETLNDVRDMSNFLSDAASQLTMERAERNQIRSIARQINKAAQESYTITQKELGTSKNVAKIQKDKESLIKKVASLSQLQNKLSSEGGEIQSDVAESIGIQIEKTQRLIAELQEVEDTSSEIANNFGVKVFNGVEDIAKAIPGLKQFAGPFKDAAESARNMAASGGNAAEAFAAGAKSLASAATAAIPLLLLNQLIKTLQFLDESSGKLAKNLGISYDEALGLTQELADSAIESNNLFINTKNLVESQIQLSEALGTNARLNQDLLVTQTELTKQAGYSVESATQLSILSLATGKSTEDITTQFLGQVKALNLTNDLALNEKQLLESVAKTSKGTLATFSSKPKELARAVFEAKKLGLEIAQVEKIADGLLDIEQSLTAEFEAEVISGKQLNLERARFFALTNDIAGVAEELGKQGVTQASFAKSSRIEQEAVAAAMGMSRDELGQMLIEQNALTAIGAKDGKEAREKFETLKAQYGEAEAIKRLGDETYAQQLASVSAQEKFAEVTNKLKDAFVSIAAPLMDIITPITEVLGPALSFIGGLVNEIRDTFASVGEFIGSFMPQLGKVGKVMAYIAKLGVVYAAYKAYSSWASIPVVGAGIGAAAAATTLIAGMAAINGLQKAGDVMSPADGKTVISTKEGGLFELSPNDDVAAAPGLLDNLKGNGIDKKISTPPPQESKPIDIKVTPSLPTPPPSPERGLERNLPTSTTVAIDYDKLANAIAKGAELGTSKAKINVNLDGNAVSNTLQTPMAMGTRRYSV